MREKYHWSEFDDLCELTRRIGVSKNVHRRLYHRRIWDSPSQTKSKSLTNLHT